MTRPILDQARTAFAMAIAPGSAFTSMRIDAALSRFDALGLTDDEKVAVIETATKFAAFGAGAYSDELIYMFLKIISTGRITNEDLFQMGRHGIRIHIRPETLAACEREARES